MIKTEHNLSQVTNAQLFMFMEAMNMIMGTGIKLNSKVLYALTKNANRFEQLIFMITRERAMLINDHYAKDEEGKPLMDENGQPYIADEKKDELEVAIREWAGKVQSVELYKFPMSLLGDVDLDFNLYTKLQYCGVMTDDIDPTASNEAVSTPEILLG